MRNATFCDVFYMKQNKSRKQTLESAQYGLEISFKLFSGKSNFRTRKKLLVESIPSIISRLSKSFGVKNGLI